jgi:Putative Ig domain
MATPTCYLGIVPPAGGLCQNAKLSPFVATGGGAPLGPFPFAEVLHDGVAGSAYSEAISAVGGNPAYNFAVTSGALPTGTTLNATSGIISGTTSAAGTFTFTVTVTDAVGNTGSQTFQIIVNSPAPSGGAYTFGG